MLLVCCLFCVSGGSFDSVPTTLGLENLDSYLVIAIISNFAEYI